MKTTLELPESLVNQIQKRADQQGREMADLVAELLSAAVAPAAVPPGAEPCDESQLVAKTLPLIKVRPVPPPQRQLTSQELSDWVKEADLQLDVERYEKTLGHQHVDRARG